MNNEQKIKQLLQLKKFETPGDAYFDAFLPEFQKFQRSRMITHQEKPSWAEWIESLVPTFHFKHALVASSGFAVAIALFFNTQTPSDNGNTIASSTNPDAQVQMLTLEKEIPRELFDDRTIHFAEAASLFDNSPFQQYEIKMVELASTIDEPFAATKFVTGEKLLAHEATLTF